MDAAKILVEDAPRLLALQPDGKRWRLNQATLDWVCLTQGQLAEAASLLESGRPALVSPQTLFTTERAVCDLPAGQTAETYRSRGDTGSAALWQPAR